VHLRRGEAGAVVVVHGFEHVVDQALDVGRADPLGRHRLGYLPEYRMSQMRDLQDGHGPFLSQIAPGGASAFAAAPARR
jgi:hypothetical protein